MGKLLHQFRKIDPPPVKQNRAAERWQKRQRDKAGRQPGSVTNSRKDNEQ